MPLSHMHFYVVRNNVVTCYSRKLIWTSQVSQSFLSILESDVHMMILFSLVSSRFYVHAYVPLHPFICIYLETIRMRGGVAVGWVLGNEHAKTAVMESRHRAWYPEGDEKVDMEEGGSGFRVFYDRDYDQINFFCRILCF